MIASMPMKVCREARARDRDERRVEAGRDRLREHRLAGPGRAEEEQPALALAAGLLERLARLPERDDAADLLLRLRLAADVLELDAPLGVAGLVAADLREAHQQQRPEEDQRSSRRRGRRRRRPGARACRLREPMPDRDEMWRTCRPRSGAPVERDQPDEQGDQPTRTDREPEPEAPVQARRRLTTSSSRSRGSSVPKRLGQGIARRIRRSMTPRKAITTSGRREHRLPRRELRRDAVEPDEDRGARQQRDDGRDARETAELRRERHRLLARPQRPS